MKAAFLPTVSTQLTSSFGQQMANTTPGRPPPEPTSSRRCAARHCRCHMAAQRPHRCQAVEQVVRQHFAADRALPSGCRPGSTFAAAPEVQQLRHLCIAQGQGQRCQTLAQLGFHAACPILLLCSGNCRGFFSDGSATAKSPPGHATDARGLAQGSRLVLVQLLAHLEAQSRHLHVVSNPWQRQDFVVGSALHLGLLAIDLAGVLDADLYLLDDGGHGHPLPLFHVKQAARDGRNLPPSSDIRLA